MPNYILGIDGGGTSCRAAIADAGGVILGRGKSGAANILTDPDTALTHIAEAARAACRDAGLDPDTITSASAILGLAGNNVGDAVHYVLQRLPFAQARIESDGLIALEGAVGSGDGAVVILGTGTIYIARRHGVVSSIGGWGFMIGDLGSGARIGQMALQESLLAFDGIRPRSELTQSLISAYDDDPGKMVEFARLARPGDFGRHAPEVFSCAGRGDVTATRILMQSAGTVDEALDRVVEIIGENGRICLLGGLAPLYGRWLADRHQARLVEPAADALTGAIALAASRYGGRMDMSA